MLVYRPADHYKAHFDFLTDDNGGPVSIDIAAQGQRVATALIRLNDEYQGGDTRFLRLDTAWNGRRGDALSFFHNTLSDGGGDPLAVHAGDSVLSGMKVLVSLWLRSRS